MKIMCAWAQARATPEKGDSQRVAMTANFQVRTFEVQRLFQVLYSGFIAIQLQEFLSGQLPISKESAWVNPRSKNYSKCNLSCHFSPFIPFHFPKSIIRLELLKNVTWQQFQLIVIRATNSNIYKTENTMGHTVRQ